jgi:RNA polymerase sigma factor (sigma-70 family)
MANTTDDIAILLARYNKAESDADRRAILESVIHRAYDRLRRLASWQLAKYPRIADPTDVVHESVLDLLRWFTEKPPSDLHEVLRRAATKMRWVLIKMKEAFENKAALIEHPSEHAAPGREDKTPTNPVARVTELISTLPERTQDVFCLHYGMGLTQTDVGRVLNIDPRQVSRELAKLAEKIGNDCELQLLLEKPDDPAAGE